MKAFLAVGLVVGAVLGGIYLVSRKIVAGKYLPGDVLAIYQDGVYDQAWVIEKRSGQYHLAFGEYPAWGEHSWYDIGLIDHDPSIYKIDHINL